MLSVNWLHVIFGYLLLAMNFQSESHAALRPVTWKGYSAATYMGNLGGATVGTKGMNSICNANYAGSHACTYDELKRLGNSYPYTSKAWVINGAYFSFSPAGTSQYQMTRDGFDLDSVNTPSNPNCTGWSSNNISWMGAAMNTTGNLVLNTCNTANYIPCCQ